MTLTDYWTSNKPFCDSEMITDNRQHIFIFISRRDSLKNMTITETRGLVWFSISGFIHVHWYDNILRWISLNSYLLKLLVCSKPPSRDNLIKRLIRGHNNVTRVRVELRVGYAT